MAVKRTGISRDLIIHPGETISDVLEDRGMTQYELAASTGTSPAFIGKIISGERDISAKFAMSLEYALGISKSFWLNLQARYDSEILEFEKLNSINDEEIKIYKELYEVSKFLRRNNIIPCREVITDAILSLRKSLRVSNLCNLNKVVSPSAFRMNVKSACNPYILGAWVRVCQLHESKEVYYTQLSKQQIDSIITKLKVIMVSDTEHLQDDIKNVLSTYGIDFEIVSNFRNAPVQGFIYRKGKNYIKICITLRGSYADIFWFSLFHELGHLVNNDISKSTQFIDTGSNEVAEEKANLFASNALINSEEYSKFISKYNENPSYSLIEQFSNEQHVKPFIVIGRMQKENIISYSQYSFAKTRYKFNR